MRQRFVEIKTAGGVMEAFVTHPEDNRPFSAVIIYMDIWGVREELYDIARRVGAVGYYCMVPDFYYRQGKRIHFEFKNEKNQTISINRLDGQALREIQARPKLSNKMVIDDTGAILEFLRGAEHVRRGGVAAIGIAWAGVMSCASRAHTRNTSSLRRRCMGRLSFQTETTRRTCWPPNCAANFTAALPSTTRTRRSQWCKNWRDS